MEQTLLELPIDCMAVIKKIKGGFMLRRRLATLNVRVGKTIKKITAQPFDGPIVLEIDNTKASLGSGMAAKIFVEEKI